MYKIRVTEVEPLDENLIRSAKGYLIRGLTTVIEPPIQITQEMVTRWYAWGDLSGPLPNSDEWLDLVEPALIGSTNEQTTIYASIIGNDEAELNHCRDTMENYTIKLLNLLGVEVALEE